MFWSLQCYQQECWGDGHLDCIWMKIDGNPAKTIKECIESQSDELDCGWNVSMTPELDADALRHVRSLSISTKDDVPLPNLENLTFLTSLKYESVCIHSHYNSVDRPAGRQLRPKWLALGRSDQLGDTHFEERRRRLWSSSCWHHPLCKPERSWGGEFFGSHSWRAQVSATGLVTLSGVDKLPNLKTLDVCHNESHNLTPNR